MEELGFKKLNLELVFSLIETLAVYITIKTCIKLSFYFFTVSFALQKFFSFRGSHLLIVALSVCATGVIFKK